jgi:GH35 family endo-1,4-beta-xylanase
MHNLLWGDNGFNGQQPSWVLNNAASGLLDLAATGNATAAADLRAEISERIDHYIGTGSPSDRAHKYMEVDIYNESYHTGSDPNLPPDLSRNYWNAYGATGIADIYREAREAVAASGAATKIFVNEYGVLGSGDYANWYVQHIEELRQAGSTAGYGDVVGGIGVQHYPGGSQNSGNIYRTLQNLSVQGLPIALTEFGVANGVSQPTAANILEDTMRMVFGTADATGFFMWGFHQESGSGATTLFAPAAALYTVNTSDFDNWTLTDPGKRYDWLLGMGEDESKGGDNPAPWDTELTDLIVDANGTINFDGFYGEYELTIGGQTYLLTIGKGDVLYSLVIARGDYDGDGEVGAADYVVWRDTLDSTTDLRADGDGDGMIDQGDYEVWQAMFGTVYGPESFSTAAVPEPAAVLMLFTGSVAVAALRRYF